MKKWMFLTAAAIAPLAGAADLSKSCMTVECNVGDHVVTYAEKSDPYYACPTRELSEYVNGTMGLVSMAYTMTGKFPNVSPTTGEPEFQGESKAMLDNWREAAKVSTLDEASSQCDPGKNKVQAMLLNSPDGGISVWVADKQQKTFWLPRGHLLKR
ncbi:hypothetical protein [Pseudomonas knackmussii]|uniref:hypothetical protein n=1 Tax=Pseudomonas knackmussii TaxID=65741 RepID=UPI003F49EE78